MDLPATAEAPQTASSQPARWAELLRAHLELTKVRLCALVVATTLVGYLLASAAPIDASHLFWTLLGTALSAFGANALNQCIEATRDGRMRRTRGRPLPSGRLQAPSAWFFALTLSAAGPIVLTATVNALTALLAVACISIYVLAYTPLKTRTTLNTLVGAVVGAIPPLMGWTAARGTLNPTAGILAGILFVWQIPHFLALAWMYRDDYARGEFRMLPVTDPTGRRTGCVVVLYCAILVPLTLMANLAHVSGARFALGALLLGGAFLTLGFRLLQERTAASARRVFLASIIYLPLLLGLMVADRVAPPDRAHGGETWTAEASTAAHLSTPPTVAEILLPTPGKQP